MVSFHKGIKYLIPIPKLNPIIEVVVVSKPNKLLCYLRLLHCVQFCFSVFSFEY